MNNLFTPNSHYRRTEPEDAEPLIGSASVPDRTSSNSLALDLKLAAKEKIRERGKKNKKRETRAARGTGNGRWKKNARRKKTEYRKRTLGVLCVENHERKKHNPLQTRREWYCWTDRKSSKKSKCRSCCGKKSQQAEACCEPITRPFRHEQWPFAWMISPKLFYLKTFARMLLYPKNIINVR